MKGKRIVFLANTAWSMYNFRLGLMRMLVQRGVEVTVIAPPDDYANRFAEFGIRFVALSRLKAKSKNPIIDLLLYLELKKKLKIVRPHLMFSYTIKPNIYGVLVAKSLNIPSIAIITGLGHGIANGGLMKATIEKLYAFSLKSAVNTWFLNDEDRTHFVNRKIIRRENSSVIPGEGIDIDYFIRKQSYPQELPIKFLYIGRLLYDKGVGDFVQAVKILKEQGERVEGRLLGFTDTLNPSAVSLSTVKSWEQQGIIRYLGQTADVRPSIEQAHCMVFPSYYSEGIPRCLLEAGSMEIPAITTNNVGCREVVIDGHTGFLCQSKNIESLVEKMKNFIKLPLEDKISMGKRARYQVSTRYSEDLIHRVYLKQIATVFGIDEKI